MKLSRRLAEVAVLVHALLSEKQMASVLQVPRNTVHARLRRIYRTTAIQGVTDLALRVERAIVADALSQTDSE
ncbi:MAG: hypothetical protein H0W15_08735 [Gemmatimonadales bacterium]|nr:hypothetical protein [Gemmatimonadales bacterium]